MLIGIVRTKADRDLFLKEHWYRVPVKNWPREGWFPETLALFETKSVTDDEQRVLHWGEVRAIERRRGAELFPGVSRGAKDDRLYWQVLIKEARERESPIPFSHDRRNPFILTTRDRFHGARNASELILGSPLEERLWSELRARRIPAEREWLAQVQHRRYWLDFALFCRSGKIDIEVDGDSYHLSEERARYDNSRNNELTSAGWSVLRFTTDQIINEMEMVAQQIQVTINTHDGLESDGVFSRRFHVRADAQQLPLFWKTGRDL